MAQAIRKRLERQPPFWEALRDGDDLLAPQVAFRMLSEVGLLESARSRRLRPLLLRPEVVNLLERHHMAGCRIA